MSKNSKKKKKNKKKKNNNYSFFMNSNFTIFEVILFIFSSIIFGMIAGCILTYSSSSLSLIRSDSNLSEIINTYKNLSNNYYGKVSSDDLENAAIKGMIESLDDPNSIFLSDNYSDDFNESVDGKYIGIGIDVALEDDYYKIINVKKDSTAEEAGLKVGDYIIKIDDVDCKNITSDELSSLVSGNINSTLKMTVNRDDEEKNFTVKRMYIDIINVSDQIYTANNKKIGYINISLFSSNTYNQFLESYKTISNEGIDSLIIDLRNNPGGHLNQARKILEIFFNKKTILYQLKNKDKITKVYSSNNKKTNYPIVILINEDSASAAEVIAACFKDNYKKATIIGTNSYGKSTVQKSQTLTTGRTIKYTVEEWLTPKGKSIEGKGVTPDIVVFNDGNDLQLVEAINTLK